MVGRLLFENGIDFREFRVRFVVSSSETLLFVNSVLVNTSNRRADLKGREEPENEGVVQVLQQQLLVLHVRQLSPFHYSLFSECFQSEKFRISESSCLLLFSEYLSARSFAWGRGRRTRETHMLETRLALFSLCNRCATNNVGVFAGQPQTTQKVTLR